MLAVGALVILGGLYMARQSFRNTLPQHQPPYTLKISTNEVYQPRTPTPFSFSVVDAQEKPLRDFTMVHEKIMHSIVVRKDLQEFQHVHPLYATQSGLFTLPDLAFPSAGAYRIFADFTPADAPRDPHGNRTPVTIFHDINVGDATAYNPQPLGPVRKTQKIDEYHITLATNPTTLLSILAATLTFTITDTAKKPVNNLEPYLGALGHSVILHENDLQFIHTHPSNNSLPTIVSAFHNR